MQQRWMRIGIGLFVALSLVLLGALIVLFNSLPRLFRATNVYTVRFSDAAGLSPGAAVRRSGVPIGVVGEMALDDQTGDVNVRVEMDAPHLIRKDEQPTLVASLLGGDAAIDLVAVPPPEGQAPDRTPLPPGTVLVGVRAGNFNQLISRASDVVPTTQDTLNDIRKSMQRIEKLTPLVEDTFREYRDLGRSLNNSVPDLRRTNDDVDKLVRSVNDAVPQATRNLDQLTHDADQLTHDGDDAAAAARAWQKVGERTDLLLRQNQDQITKAIGSLNDVLTRTSSLLSDANVRNVTDTLHNVRISSDSLPSIARNTDETLKQGPEIARNANDAMKEGRESLKHFNTTLEETDQLLVELEKVTKPFVERSEPVARNLDETMTKLNRTLTTMNQLVEAIGQSNGTFNKLLTDPSLYNNLDDAACQAAKAAPQLNLILKDVETFTDKLARHPELIGIGGAIRPSSGLKDAPSPPPGLIISPQHP